jgi:chromosome segregation ATPase
LRIIDQANANRNKAQGDIQTFTQAYNDAFTNQRAAQNAILSAETRSAQIVSAINSLTSTISDLINKINDAVARRDGLTRQKATIIATITDLEGKRAGLNDNLKALDKDLADNIQKLSDYKTKCNTFNDAVNAKQN